MSAPTRKRSRCSTRANWRSSAGPDSHQVFFGEAIVGSALPNLTYLLVFPDEEGRKSSWAPSGDRCRVEKLGDCPGTRTRKSSRNITNKILDPDQCIRKSELEPGYKPEAPARVGSFAGGAQAFVTVNRRSRSGQADARVPPDPERALAKRYVSPLRLRMSSRSRPFALVLERREGGVRPGEAHRDHDAQVIRRQPRRLADFQVIRQHRHKPAQEQAARNVDEERAPGKAGAEPANGGDPDSPARQSIAPPSETRPI